MKYWMMLWMSLAAGLQGAEHNASDPQRETPLETFVIAPAEIATIQIWVPADKMGPVINRACMDRCRNQYKCFIPASVNHEKTQTGMNGVGRLLAEYAWLPYEESLPLTIFKGWKWEFPYSLSQFEAFEYDLPRRGGSCENSLEAILNESQGSLTGMWVQDTTKIASGITNSENPMSTIEVRTFSSTRIRHGYPKFRKMR